MTTRIDNLARSFWAKACREDQIDSSAPFVIFSRDNEYADAYNRARFLEYRMRKHHRPFQRKPDGLVMDWGFGLDYDDLEAQQ